MLEKLIDKSALKIGFTDKLMTAYGELPLYETYANLRCATKCTFDNGLESRRVVCHPPMASF